MDANLKKALVFLAIAIGSLIVFSIVWALIKAIILPMAILALIGAGVYSYFRFVKA